MEVTSVSPSATSPTEGDDLCEIDVTAVAIHIVTLPFSLCGLAGNGAVLLLLRLNAHNSGIFQLAFADFLFLLFTVPSVLLFLVEDISCSPILPLLYQSFFFQLSLISCYWALFWLFRANNMDYMQQLSKLCCCRKPPDRLLWLVYSVQFWSFFALFTVIPTVILQCPSHQQEHCRASLISVYTVILLLMVVPPVISHTINFIKAKRGSKEQQPKRRDIFMILVVLLVFLLSLFNFLQQLGYILVSSHVVFLLNCIHSSIKPLIYFLVGKCWRPSSMGSHQLLHVSVLEPEENPFSLESLRLSLRRVFDGLQETTYCKKSLRLSLKIAFDRLERNILYMDSLRISVRSILDGLEEKPSFVESLQLPVQRGFDEPKENTAHSNDAHKDTGV